MPKCDFNKVALQSNFIEIALWHGCSPVNLLHIFRTPFHWNSCGWLLVDILILDKNKASRHSDIPIKIMKANLDLFTNFLCTTLGALSNHLCSHLV